MAGKCPSCQAAITNVDLKGPTIGNQVFGPLLRGYMAVCPRCQAIVGVMADPHAIAAEVAEKILGKKR